MTTAEGLVMGADSMTVAGDSVIEKHYANANKVFQILGLPIVVMTYGTGNLGRRSIGSLVDEWSQLRPAYEEQGYSVEQVAQDLGAFIFGKHREHRDLVRVAAEESQAKKIKGELEGEELTYKASDWTTGLIVGGYQPGSPYPWLYTWEEPEQPGVLEGLQSARPHEGAHGEHGPAPGLDAWGDTGALDRLLDGIDPSLAGSLVHAGLLTVDEPFQAIAAPSQWDILYEGMPIQDAADLTRFVLQVAVGFERFRAGNPRIGGDLDIAIVTRKIVHWYDRKPLTTALAPRVVG